MKINLSPPAVVEEIALINSNNVGGSPFGEQAKVNMRLKTGSAIAIDVPRELRSKWRLHPPQG